MKHKFVVFTVSETKALLNGGAVIPENMDSEDFVETLLTQNQAKEVLEEYEKETGKTSICTSLQSYSKEELLEKINNIEEMEGIPRDKMTKLGNSSITNCTKSTFSEKTDENEKMHKEAMGILEDLADAPAGFKDMLKMVGIPTDYNGIMSQLKKFKEKEEEEKKSSEVEETEEAQIQKVLEAFNDLPVAIQKAIKELGIPTTEHELRTFDYKEHEDELLNLVDMLLGGRR